MRLVRTSVDELEWQLPKEHPLVLAIRRLRLAHAADASPSMIRNLQKRTREEWREWRETSLEMPK
jgi:hypothetical protein